MALRSKWASLLTGGPDAYASHAIKYNDPTTDTLFGPKAAHSKHVHKVAHLSARKEDQLTEEQAAEMYRAFKEMKTGMRHNTQTSWGLRLALHWILNLPQWSKSVDSGLQPVLECIICMDNLQYGVIAYTEIPSNTRIYELIGKLSVDNVDSNAKSKTTTLSEMFAEDSTTRILYGPIQFINHS
ncbi:hypothetical protein K438DRAFT_1781829 [Mycena galopus ATCC 62051]|nr:hypothetical protein K438DRAFT_1781829 [Mycena galopus ATCC 62051]